VTARWSYKNMAVQLFYFSYPNNVGRDSSVGIVTRYGLNGLEIESQRGSQIFRTCPNRPWAHPASYTMGTGSFPGVNRPGRGVDHPPSSSADVKERVELRLRGLFKSNFTFVLTTTLHRGWEKLLSRGEYVSHCACVRQGYESKCQNQRFKLTNCSNIRKCLLCAFKGFNVLYHEAGGTTQ